MTSGRIITDEDGREKTEDVLVFYQMPGDNTAIE